MTTEKLSTFVIVLEEDGKMVGKFHFRDAERLAFDRGLDLVLVSEKDGTSVCKIADRGKWLYEQKKKAPKKIQNNQLKEMQFGIRIEPHDQITKTNQISKFLEKGHDVRIVVEMKGREKANPEMARKKLDSIVKELNCEVREDSYRSSPKNISVLIKPKKTDSKNVKSSRNESAQEGNKAKPISTQATA